MTPAHLTRLCKASLMGQETFIINKLECVGHIQKRLGCRLRTLQQTCKGKKLSDGKGISGKGKLTDRAVNLL